MGWAKQKKMRFKKHGGVGRACKRRAFELFTAYSQGMAWLSTGYEQYSLCKQHV